MAKRFPCLDDTLRGFISRQHVFFTASAASGSRINVSPRDAKTFRVIDDRTVVYLDRTGSGNETAAHLKADGRLTIMFCAFEGAPNILRLYGRGIVLHRDGPAFAEMLVRAFGGKAPAGTRQMVRLHVGLVTTSCGYGVPIYTYVGERDDLEKWSERAGPEATERYWRANNMVSIDGLPTGIFDKPDA